MPNVAAIVLAFKHLVEIDTITIKEGSFMLLQSGTCAAMKQIRLRLFTKKVDFWYKIE